MNIINELSIKQLELKQKLKDIESTINNQRSIKE